MASELAAQSLVDSLAEALRHQVLTGDFPPGSRITELEISKRYSVARPTAKAAIERVVQTGILRRAANKTARVPELSESDIVDLFRSRLFFEYQVVTELAQRRGAPAAAEKALVDMRASLTTDPSRSSIEPDIGFHLALVAEIGSPRISRMNESIMGEAHLLMGQERRTGVIDAQQNLAEHVGLLNAIRNGQVQLSQHLIREHLEGSAERMLRSGNLKSSDDTQAADPLSV